MDIPVSLKRINVLTVIFVLLGGLLLYRLTDKQIFQHRNYLALAENQYLIKKDLPAARGKIYASDMFPLATSSRVYQVVAVPHQIPSQDKKDTAIKLAPLLGQSAQEIFALIDNDKYYIPPLKKRLSEEEGQKIADLKLKGVTVVPESVRFYPEGQLASQILGFVDANSDGHYGLEGYYNNELAGIGGKIFGQKDTRGRLFDIAANLRPQNGLDFVLTLDHNIQYQAENILAQAVKDYEADSGSIVINEPKTGKILAMANFPTFDANSFNKVEDQSVFNNPAIGAAWEPGSIFKPLIMAAAIDEGKVQPETEEVFSNSVTVDSYEIHTSTNEAYGRETMTKVLENSDNVAMVWVSELLGRDSMYKYIKDFGFGRKSGIELDTESAGEVAEAKKWSNTQRATIAFGQGITATPLQILAAISAIANKGKLMQPYIVQKTIDANGKEDARQSKEVARVLKEETAAKVVGMMVSVVERGHGKKAGVSGYKVAGKTGTAQVPKPGGGYYADRHIGSFVGFAPASDPKFAMIVRLDNPKAVEWAESSAAPAFGQMARWLLDYFQIPPEK